MAGAKCIRPVAIVRPRQPVTGFTWYPVEFNQQDFVAVSPRQAPDQPRQSEAAGPTRHARMPHVFFFHKARPWGDDFAQIDEFGRVFQAGPQADYPGGTEQPVMRGDSDRPNVLRRPSQPYGNRSGANTLI